MKRLILLFLGSIFIMPVEAMDRLFKSKKTNTSENSLGLLEQLLTLPEKSRNVFLTALNQEANVNLVAQEFIAQQKKSAEEIARQKTEQESYRLETAQAEVRREQVKKAVIEKELEKNMQQLAHNIALKEIDLGNMQQVEQKRNENATRLEQERQRIQKDENNRFIAAKDQQNKDFLEKQRDQEARLLKEKDKREKERLEAAREQHEKQIAADKALHDKKIEENKKAHDREMQNQQRLIEEKARTREDLLKKEEAAKERIRKAELQQQNDIEKMKQLTNFEKAKVEAEKQKALIVFAREEEEKHPGFYAQKRKDDLVAKKDEFNNKVLAIKNSITDFSQQGHLKKLCMYTSISVAGTAGTILFFKNAWPIARQVVENWLFTPFLIDETNIGWSLPGKRKPIDQKLEDLFFDADQTKQINTIAQTFKKTREKDGYYLNYLFYGPPGSGKTATARALARESNMKYAMMSGGNVVKLLKTGKAEERIKEVFTWATNSSEGLLLFIDEADAFLMDPKNKQMSEELYSAINSFLNLSGFERKKMSIIFSSNHPNALAPAILDRIGAGQFIYFGLPKLEERKQMAKHFIKKYLRKVERTGNEPSLLDQSIADGMNDDEIAEYIASKTEGFSGRNISYLVLAMEKALLMEDTPALTHAIIDRVITTAVHQKQESLKFHSYA